jgi:serine protease
MTKRNTRAAAQRTGVRPVVAAARAVAMLAATLAGLAACQPRSAGAPPAASGPGAGTPPAAAAAAAASAAAAVAASLPVLPVSPQAVAQLLERRAPANFVPGVVIVKMKGGPRAVMAPAQVRQMQVEPVGELTSGGERIYRLQATVQRALAPEAVRDRTLELARTMAARPDVEYAQPNWILGIGAVPNDPAFPQQWHYQDNGSAPGQVAGGINLPQVWDQNKGNNAVVVAVIDTGILPQHPDIAGSPNLVPGFDMISDPSMANDGGGRDNDATDPGDGSAAGECFPGTPAQPNSWHGTHVAGTVGVGLTNNGVGVAGINWTVRVQAVRVLGKCGGTMADINDGIRWAAGLPVPGAPNNPTPAKVINMSLGGQQPCSASPATQAAINDAVNAGVTVVVAAGNSAADASGFLPASCNGVITVAAGDARGHLVARYSNFGPRIDLLAPGGDTQRDDNGDGQNDGVLSMVQGGYARYNGTSMASPHVAGVAALLLAAEPALTPAQVLAKLKAFALQRDTTQCPRPCGAGLLNARAALPGSTPPPPPPPPSSGVVLTPPSLNVAIGQTQSLTATVTAGGAPAAGKTVQFTVANATVAAVNPASASTDATGKATTNVTGLTPGTTTVTATADANSGSSTITVPARLAAFGGRGALVAALVLLALGALVIRRNRRKLRLAGARVRR